MPFYDYHCRGCGKVHELMLTLAEFDSFRAEPRCHVCGELMDLEWGGPRNFILKGRGFPDRDRRGDDLVGQQMRIMNEPLTDGEMNEIPDMLREREKELGYEPGTLTKREGRKYTEVVHEEVPVDEIIEQQVKAVKAKGVDDKEAEDVKAQLVATAEAKGESKKTIRKVRRTKAGKQALQERARAARRARM